MQGNDIKKTLISMINFNLNNSNIYNVSGRIQRSHNFQIRVKCALWQSGSQTSQLRSTTAVLSLSLTCQYVCIPGCNGLNLHDARLCGLGREKERGDIYIQRKVYQKVLMVQHRRYRRWTQPCCDGCRGETARPGCREAEGGLVNLLRTGFNFRGIC